MKNTGKKYEEFVRKLQQAIIDSDKNTELKNITVEKNKIIKDKNGINREFDLYWEFELGGINYKTVIECKDYKSKIKINKIDEFVGKLQDIPGLKPIFATTKGYESGALKKAEQHGIEPLVMREQNDSDWKDEIGNFLTKILRIEIIAFTPAYITKVDILYDGNWIKENRPDIDITKPYQMIADNREIFIDDIIDKEKYSIYDLATKLTSQENKPGEYEKTKGFKEAYILFREDRIKVSFIKVHFYISKPFETQIEKDYSQNLVGVVEYPNRGIKKKFFENGDIYQEKLPDDKHQKITQKNPKNKE